MPADATTCFVVAGRDIEAPAGLDITNFRDGGVHRFVGQTRTAPGHRRDEGAEPPVPHPPDRRGPRGPRERRRGRADAGRHRAGRDHARARRGRRRAGRRQRRRRGDGERRRRHRGAAALEALGPGAPGALRRGGRAPHRQLAQALPHLEGEAGAEGPHPGRAARQPARRRRGGGLQGAAASHGGRPPSPASTRRGSVWA